MCPSTVQVKEVRRDSTVPDTGRLLTSGPDPSVTFLYGYGSVHWIKDPELT